MEKIEDIVRLVWGKGVSAPPLPKAAIPYTGPTIFLRNHSLKGDGLVWHHDPHFK
jgi:hypothetical protein